MNTKEKVYFKNKELKMVGEIHFPLNFDPDKKYAGIVIYNLGNGVKEQVAGLYSQKLAKNV